MQNILVPIALGLVSGALGGLMGVGGGIVLVPLLVHIARLGQHEAQGTSLAFVIATSLVAAVPYFRYERLDLGLAALLALGAVPGVLLGSRVASRTPASRLRVAFGLLIVVVAARILIAPPGHGTGGGLWAAPLEIPLGLGVGILAGLLGVGGGTLLVPVLVLAQGVDQHTAQGVSLLMIVPVGIVGVASYSLRGRLPERGLLPLLAGGAAGALGGALLAHRIEGPTLSRLFALFLIAAGAHMIFRKPPATIARSTPATGGVP